MDERDNVRARALRAARVVTLGLAIASAPACGASHVAGTVDSGNRSDSGSGSDSGSDPEDAGQDGALADAGTQNDAGLVCPDVFPPPNRECCEAEPGGFWDEASGQCVVAVPGPFVPPSEEGVHV